MKIEVKIDARRPFYGVCSVRELWHRFIEGRRIIYTFKERMTQVGYRGDLSNAYDKLIVLYNSDLAHIQTIIALLGLDLAKKVCAVPDNSITWEKLFVNGHAEKENFAIPAPPIQRDAVCDWGGDDGDE